MDILHSHPPENLQIDSVLIATIQIWSKFREVLLKNLQLWSPIVWLLWGHEYHCQRVFSMCACPTRSGLWGANAVGEVACAECMEMCTIGETIKSWKG